MQGVYIELPCEYYTMLTFKVCNCLCLHVHALLSKQERGITLTFVMCVHQKLA